METEGSFANSHRLVVSLANDACNSFNRFVAATFGVRADAMDALSDDGISIECEHLGRIALFVSPSLVPELAIDCTVLCILSVPLGFTVEHLCSIAAISIESVARCHRITDPESNQSSLIIQFRSLASAHQVSFQCNGRPFDPKRLEICYVLSVLSIVGLPCMMQMTQSEGYPASSSWQQIPSCAMCIERIDTSVSGIANLQCSHANAMCNCVSVWESIDCPSCSTIALAASDTDRLPQCQSCGSKDNLWMCLLCAHVGCNRFHLSHAIDHFQEYGHRYSVELKHQYVWDYQGDGYIHRTANACSGTSPTVLKPQEAESSALVDDADGFVRAKFDSLVNYYDSLLTEQLETQRDHFKVQMREEEFEFSLELEAIISARGAVDDELQQLSSEEAALSRAAANLQKKLMAVRSRITAIDNEIEFTRELNISLMGDQRAVRQQLKDQSTRKLAELDRVIADLTCTLNEAMSNLS